MNSRDKSRFGMSVSLLCALLTSIPSHGAVAQRRDPGPFSPFRVQESRAYSPNLGFEDQGQEDESPHGWCFPRRVGIGALAGALSGAFLGSLISDWNLPSGAAVGAVTGTLTGLAVAVVAENGRMSRRRGFLIGAILGYGLWLVSGAPVDFVLDPLFLVAIPGWFAGGGPYPPIAKDGGG
jgi:hypothetical protein